MHSEGGVNLLPPPAPTSPFPILPVSLSATKGHHFFFLVHTCITRNEKHHPKKKQPKENISHNNKNLTFEIELRHVCPCRDRIVIRNLQQRSNQQGSNKGRQDPERTLGKKNLHKIFATADGLKDGVVAVELAPTLGHKPDLNRRPERQTPSASLLG